MNQYDLMQVLTAEGADLDTWQMALRAFLVYGLTLFIVRLGKKRLFGKSTAMDLVLAVLLGSVVSRTVNGTATLLPTAVASIVLVGIHALSAKFAVMWPAIGHFLKGSPRLLIKDGQTLPNELKASDISRHDLEESLRCSGSITDPSKVAEAWLERNGTISIIPAKSGPQILEVNVEPGVQTVRIKIE